MHLTPEEVWASLFQVNWIIPALQTAELSASGEEGKKKSSLLLLTCSPLITGAQPQWLVGRGIFTSPTCFVQELHQSVEACK